MSQPLDLVQLEPRFIMRQRFGSIGLAVLLINLFPASSTTVAGRSSADYSQPSEVFSSGVLHAASDDYSHAATMDVPYVNHSAAFGQNEYVLLAGHIPQIYAPAIGGGDADGDGWPDVFEVAAGSDPTDPDSLPLETPNMDDSLWSADPDGDGLNNIIELFTGNDPTIASSFPLLLKLENHGLVLIYRRSKKVPAEAGFIELSDNLTDWTRVGGVGTVLSITEDRLDSNIEYVKMSIVLSDRELHSMRKLFFRLVIDLASTSSSNSPTDDGSP